MKNSYKVRYRDENYDDKLRELEYDCVTQFYSNKSGGVLLVSLIVLGVTGYMMYVNYNTAEGIPIYYVVLFALFLFISIGAAAAQVTSNGKIAYDFGIKGARAAAANAYSISVDEREKILNEYKTFKKNGSTGGYRSVDEYAFYFSGEPITKKQNLYFGFLEMMFTWTLFIGATIIGLYFLSNIYLESKNSTNSSPFLLLIIGISLFASSMAIMIIKTTGKFVFLDNFTFRIRRKRKMYDSNVKKILDEARKK